MTRPSWLDPKSLQTAVAVAVLAAIANGIWIFLDHSSPSWDQAHYLTVTLEYRYGHALEGIGGMLRAIGASDPSHGPLFTVAMLPFFYAFGSAAQSGLLLNLVLAPVLYISAGQIAWIVFRRWQARLLTTLLVATMPLMVGLFHNVLQEFLLVTLTTVSVLLLLLTDSFRHRGISLVLGLAMGLGTLTKVTFPAFMVGPLLVVLAQIAIPGLRESAGIPDFQLRRRIENAAGVAGVYLLVALPWYLPNLSATLDYIRSTTSGPLSEGAGPSNPLTFHAIASFTLGVLNENVSWIIGLAGLIAVVLCFPQLRNLFRKPVRVERLMGPAFLLAWALIPYLLVATAHNQDVRLMAPAMPAMAVIVAGAMSAMRQTSLRVGLIVITAVALVYQSVNHVARITPSFLPSDVHVEVGSYRAVIPLDDRPIGYERLPEPDYATPVIAYIEQRADREPADPTPKRICVLESEPVINTNTFLFLVKARNDQFEVGDVLIGGEGRPRLRTALSDCDFALYVKQPPPEPVSGDNRITLVNEDFAANHMTPSLFALFPGPSRTFPIVVPQRDKGRARYLSITGRGENVRVLSKGASAPASP